jgi:hypothetical protein
MPKGVPRIILFYTGQHNQTKKEKCTTNSTHYKTKKSDGGTIQSNNSIERKAEKSSCLVQKHWEMYVCNWKLLLWSILTHLGRVKSEAA